MKDVLLSNAGVQVYIIDGSRRTDGAARAVITALYKAGRICKEAAERAWSDRATLDKIKKYMVHCKMETRATETGDRWTFYTKTGVFMDIEAYSRNYITADADGNLYPTEAPTEPETNEGKEDTTTTKTEPQEGTESSKKTADDTTPAGSDTDHTEATQDEEKTIRTGARLYSHPHRHMVTVEGLQGELVRVIYKGRLYLVCCSDLYTDETETTPAMLPQATESAGTTAGDTTPTAGDTEPQRATETAQKAAGGKSITTTTEGTQEGAQTAGTSEGAETTTPPHTEPPRATERAAAAGSVSQTSRRTRPAAPQSHGTTKGIQRHTTPPKTAYRAIQSAVHIPEADRRRVATSRGSPKICIFLE